MKSVHSDLSRIKCWTCNFACASKDDLTIHNDKYWYSHRMRPNQNHKKYMLEEFEDLKKDGFIVKEDTINMVTDWKD